MRALTQPFRVEQHDHRFVAPALWRRLWEHRLMSPTSARPSASPRPEIGSCYRVLRSFGSEDPFSPGSVSVDVGDIVTFARREYSFYDGVTVLWFDTFSGLRVALVLADYRADGTRDQLDSFLVEI